MKRRTALSLMAHGLGAGVLPGALWAAPGSLLAQLSEALDDARLVAGLEPLIRHPALMATGRRQVAHMQALRHITHLDASGRTPEFRAAHSGYSGQVLGEVLAETYGTPAETVEAWLMNSATRAVLLDPEARDVGLALHNGGTGLMWWAVTTGVRGGTGKISMNSKNST